MALSFNEEIIGKMGRIYKIMANHIPESEQEGELSEEEKILANISLEPEEQNAQGLIVPKFGRNP